MNHEALEEKLVEIRNWVLMYKNKEAVEALKELIESLEKDLE